MLYVIDPAELQHFQAIEELAREERREAAEQFDPATLRRGRPIAGSMPMVYIREGRPRDELLELINEEPTISILVLAAARDPRPRTADLVSYRKAGGAAAHSGNDRARRTQHRPGRSVELTSAGAAGWACRVRLMRGRYAASPLMTSLTLLASCLRLNGFGRK